MQRPRVVLEGRGEGVASRFEGLRNARRLEGVIVESEEVMACFVDKAGFSIVYDRLRLEPALVLHAQEDDGTRRVYLLEKGGLWRITEPPTERYKGVHTFEFVPFGAIGEIVATLTDSGRDDLLGPASTRFYPGLASMTVEVRPLTGDAWTINGASLADFGMSDDDPRLSDILGSLFDLCGAVSENGVPVRILSPGSLEDVPPKTVGT